MRLGEKALEYALAELGNGEVGQANSGPHTDKYGMGVARNGIAWCAKLISYCVINAADELGVVRPRYSSGARRLGDYLLEYASAKLVKEKEILPGDVVVWRRRATGAGLNSSYAGHVGITLMRTPTGFITVEGNKGTYPAAVAPFFHKFGEADLLQVIRLP